MGHGSVVDGHTALRRARWTSLQTLTMLYELPKVLLKAHLKQSAVWRTVLSPSTLLADRRASVLALKGLARDWKAEVSEISLQGLLGVLENDAEIDADIAKAGLRNPHHSLRRW